MSLGIQLENGAFIKMYSKSNIKFVEKSMLFSPSNLFQNRSYEFSIPRVENEMNLNFHAHFDIRKRVYEYSCNLFVSGLFVGVGKLSITNFTDNSFKVRVLLNDNALRNELNRSIRSYKYLKPTEYRYAIDLTTGLPTLPYTKHIFSFSAGQPTSGPTYNTVIEYECTVTGLVVIKKVPYTPPQTLIEHIDNIVDAINSTIEVDCVKAVRIGNDIQVYNLGGNDIGVSIAFYPDDINWYTYFNDTINSFEHPSPIRMEYNHVNDVINNPELFDYIYFPVFTGSLSFSTFDFKNIINHYYPAQNGLGPAINGFDDNLPNDWIKHNVFQPFAYLKDVLYMIFNELNYQIVIDDFFDKELSSLVFFVPLFSTRSKDNIVQNLTRSFKYSEILPDINVNELIQELNLRFGFCMSIDLFHKNVSFYRTNKLLSDSYIPEDYTNYVEKQFEATNINVSIEYKTNWSDDETFAVERIFENKRFNILDEVETKNDLPVISNNKDIALAYKENYYYIRVNSFGVLSWNFFSEGLDDSTDVNKNSSQISDVSTLFSLTSETAYTKSGLTVKWLLPGTKKNIYFFDEQPNNINTILLFYRGMQRCYVRETSGGEFIARTYPMGSYFNYDIDGNKIGNYNLSWNHKDGLINIFLKKYIEMLNKPIIKFSMKMPYTVFRKINILKSVRIGNQTYAIEEIVSEVSGDLVSAVFTVRNI